MGRVPKPIETNQNNSYKLKDFIGKDDEYIKNSEDYVLVDINILKQNFDLFKHVLKIRKSNIVSCLDYESAIFIEQNYKDKKLTLVLLDDGKNIDRSYIKPNLFINHELQVPLPYTMWNIDFKDSLNINCFKLLNDRMASFNGNKKLMKDTYLKYRELIEKLNLSNYTDLEKILLIEKYFKENIKYLDDEGLIKIVDIDINKARDIVSSVDSIINNNYGLCVGFANATTLLSNNPTINLNTRSIHGPTHAWNIININNKFYYQDNTWVVTRDSYSKYCLFGKYEAEFMGYHVPITDTYGNIENEDYDKEKIKNLINRLTK